MPPTTQSETAPTPASKPRLEITLVHGSILDVATHAVVLGSFRNVDPGGAAKAIDARLNGALRDLIRSRTVSSEPGSIFILPTGRSGLLTDMVIFAGLGPFDRFEVTLIELVATNLVRTLIRCRVDEFATVLFGAGSGFDARACAHHLLRGVIGGLRDSDADGQFRGLTICELDDKKFDAIREAIYQGCRADFCDGFDIVVRERVLSMSVPPPVTTPAVAAASPVAAEPLYLLVRTDGSDEDQLRLRAAVLTAGGNAAVLDDVRSIKRSEVDSILSAIEAEGFGNDELMQLGVALGDAILPKRVRTVLAEAQQQHIAIVHDLEAARLPWEALRLEKWIPAMTAGTSRRYLAADLSVGRWAAHRQQQEQLSVLLIVDPTENLAGAVKESDRIAELAATNPKIKVTKLSKKEATKARVLEHLQSEQFDVVHYAGHAAFSPLNPGESGIVCADEMLRAVDLLNVRSLPSLLFFNACESGRLRTTAASGQSARAGARDTLNQTVGFAEALMRFGVMNYVGTYWPVGDESAASFSREFYRGLLAGETIGDALLSGRKSVHEMGSVDWADYIHYGDPAFRLKTALGR